MSASEARPHDCPRASHASNGGHKNRHRFQVMLFQQLVQRYGGPGRNPQIVRRDDWTSKRCEMTWPTQASHLPGTEAVTCLPGGPFGNDPKMMAEWKAARRILAQPRNEEAPAAGPSGRVQQAA